MNGSAKEGFYAELHAVVDSCSTGDKFVVPRDFNATTGTDKDNYESCVCPHGYGSSFPMPVDSIKSRKWKMAEYTGHILAVGLATHTATAYCPHSGINKARKGKAKLGANAMKRVAAGAHLPTP